MKRSVSERDHYHNQYDQSLTMANCLMFLSRSSGVYSPAPLLTQHSSASERVFECKTCNRQFPSFQALGGHRASHKKPRLSSTADGGGGSESGGGSPAKPKTHECTVCGLEFSIGQALGGHMRRHRAAMADQTAAATGAHHYPPLWMASDLRSPVVKKISSNNGRRVLCLDLNLTPLENDIKILQLGNPLVNIF